MAIYNKTELYFFKFPNTFFEKDEIEELAFEIDGDSLIVLYLKLITLAINKGGYLCKIISGELIPYTTEELCRKTNTDLDVFKRRIKRLKKVGLVELKDDMLYIEEALNYTNQTVGAIKKQEQRKNKKDKCPPYCPPDIDIEQEEELEYRNKKKEKREKILDSSELQEESYPALQDICNQVVDYLNKKAYKNFKPDSKKTVSLIKLRLSEGYQLEDFYKVIDNKVEEWLSNGKLDEYIRPITLFGSNFGDYLFTEPLRQEVDWKSKYYDIDVY